MSVREILLATALFVLTVVLAWANVDNPIKMKEVLGTYELKNIGLLGAPPTPAQVLVLHDDNSYSNTFKKGNETVWTYKETWKFETDSFEPGVTFKNLRIAVNRFGKFDGYWGLKTERYRSTIRMCPGDPDSHTYCFVLKK